MMWMKIDFSQTVTKWQPPNLKEWETTGETKLIIMSYYRMWFEIAPTENGANTKLSISFVPREQTLYKIRSFFFVKLYCKWCLNNILYDTKKHSNLRLGLSQS